MRKRNGKEIADGGCGKKTRIKTAVLLMAVAALLFTGCGNSEKVIEGDSQDRGGQSNVDGITESNLSETGEGSNSGNGDEERKGYVFTYNGVSIGMDAPAEPLITALGEPKSYFEAASCAFEGLDRMYTYSGFELDTYPTNGDDFVSAVVLKDDSVATAEGVAIGDNRSKVEEKYGTATSSTDTLLIYEKDGMELRFLLKGEEVVSIEYMSKVSLSQ